MSKINLSLLFLITFTSNIVWADRQPLPASRLEQLSGVRSDDSKQKWDKKFSSRSYIYGKSPAKFLAENYHYIPYGASVLDMGMGEGRNAVFLAQKGYKVTGIDISSVAVKKSLALAKEFGVQINTVVASLNKYKIPEGTFDAIICFYYVDRSLVDKMKSWLKPGGVIVYEAYTVDQKNADPNLKGDDPSYYLKKQELLHLFDMRILKFEEPIHEKEYRSSLIVKKKG
ncbi:MAG: class I SAM-dependent methyltransferase [Bacteriovoracaceae bacterium]